MQSHVTQDFGKNACRAVERMRLHLNERWVNHLRGLPETGMGYQIVDVVLRNGEWYRGIVVHNAEEMEWPAGAGKAVQEDIVEITRAKVEPQDEPVGWRRVHRSSGG